MATHTHLPLRPVLHKLQEFHHVALLQRAEQRGAEDIALAAVSTQAALQTGTRSVKRPHGQECALLGGLQLL